MGGSGIDKRFGGDLLSSGALVFASSMVLNVGGFIFHAVASRKLGVAEYGALYALISVYSLAAMPVLVFAPVIVRFAAEFRAIHDDGHVRGLVALIARWFGIIGVAYIVVSFAFNSQLAAFLHVERWGIPTVGVLAAVGLFSNAMRSLAQGTHDFKGFAVSTVAEGVAKVVAIVAFAAVGLTLLRGVLGFLIGLTIGALIMSVPLFVRYHRVAPLAVRLDWPRIWITVWGAASLAITTGLVGYADVVLVKHYFPPHAAGLYSAASLGGKILLYFVGFVPAVLIPHATDRFTRGERTRGTIWASLGFIAIAGVVGVIFYRFLGLHLLHALVGTAFDEALPLLVEYAAAMALLAATSALGSYGIATHRLGFAAPLVVGAFVTLAAIAAWHPNLQFVVSELVLGNVAMFAVVAAALSWQGYVTRSHR